MDYTPRERSTLLRDHDSFPYDAPAQRVENFLAGRPSTELGTVAPSYTPGLKPATS
jgi:hypothetical protein